MLHIHQRPTFIENIKGRYYRTVRIMLRVARVLNSICHLIMAALFFGLAFYLAVVPARQAPFWDVVAFLAVWWGIAIGCEGLDQLQQQEDDEGAEDELFLLDTSPTVFAELARPVATQNHFNRELPTFDELLDDILRAGPRGPAQPAKSHLG
ncbi:hypothetical protein NLM31_12940 [Bradyrhizobium sp. CCGUVB4N]|uniref:hypothetical protein n=1 Tax=Bradyrhizobium sp. CCGUVB4N TaxID=2949631 RepID=UPI0020B1DCCA|nr:hypothetical protein [Bradyrhizobium sp. CCGUVB4N]MCP3381246.1 hypothetical protein [Bradyrhizobium sp. CCGUVB4N]